MATSDGTAVDHTSHVINVSGVTCFITLVFSYLVTSQCLLSLPVVHFQAIGGNKKKLSSNISGLCFTFHLFRSRNKIFPQFFYLLI